MPGPVLLVHDDIAVIAPVKRVLQRQGFDTLLVTNAADAVITFGDLLPEVVVLAPEVDGGRGDSICQEIRAHPKGSQVRFIALGSPVASAPEAAVIEMPLDGKVLLEAVERAMEGGEPAEVFALSEPVQPAAAQEKPAKEAPAPESMEGPAAELAATLFGDFPAADTNGEAAIDVSTSIAEPPAAVEPPPAEQAAEPPAPDLADSLDANGAPEPEPEPSEPAPAAQEAAAPAEASPEPVPPPAETPAAEPSAASTHPDEWFATEAAEAGKHILSGSKPAAPSSPDQSEEPVEDKLEDAREDAAQAAKLREEMVRRLDETYKKAAEERRRADETRRAVEAEKAKLDQLKAERDEASKALAELNRARQSEKAELDELKAALEKEQARVESAQRTAEEERARIQALREQASGQAGEHERLGAEARTQADALGEQIRQAEELRRGADEEEQRLQETRKKIESEVAEVAHRREEAKKKADAIQHRLEDEALKTEELSRGTEENRKRADDLGHRREQLTRQAEQVQGQLEQVQGEVAGLEEELAQAKQADADLSAKAAELREALAQEKEKSAKLKHAGEAAHAQLEKLRHELQIASEALAEQEKSFESEREEKKQALATFKEQLHAKVEAAKKEWLAEKHELEEAHRQELAAKREEQRARLDAKLKEQAAEQERKLDEEREQVEAKTEELAALNQQARERLDQAKANLAKESSSADELSKQVAELKEKAESALAREQAEKVKLAELQAAVGATEERALKEIEACRDQAKKVVERREELGRQIEQARAGVDEAARRSEELEKVALEAKRRRDEARQRVEELRQAAQKEAELSEDAVPSLEREADGLQQSLDAARARRLAAEKRFEAERAAHQEEERRARDYVEAAEREAKERSEAAQRILAAREDALRKSQAARREEQQAIRLVEQSARHEQEISRVPESASGPQPIDVEPPKVRPFAAGRWKGGIRVTSAPPPRPVSAEPSLEAEIPQVQPAALEPSEGFKSTPPAAGTQAPFAARGTLALLDGPTLVCRAFDARLTGRLDVAGPDAQRTLWFEEGRLVAASSTQLMERLEEIALRMGLIGAAQHHALRTSDEKLARRLALQMVELGYIRPSEMYPLVRKRVQEIAWSVFLDDQSPYLYTPESPPAEERVVLPMHPWAVVTDGVKRKLSAERLWAKLGGPATLLRPKGQIELDYFGLPAREKRLAAMVDGLRTLEEILFEGGLEEQAALKVLYSLVVAGAVEIAVLGQAARARSPQEAARLDLSRVSEKYNQILGGDYFQILGLRRDATSYEVHEAYERLVREFDPDRFLGIEDGGLIGKLKEIGRSLAEAADVLVDDAVRAEYARSLAD